MYQVTKSAADKILKYKCHKMTDCSKKSEWSTGTRGIFWVEIKSFFKPLLFFVEFSGTKISTFFFLKKKINKKNTPTKFKMHFVHIKLKSFECHPEWLYMPLNGMHAAGCPALV